MTPQKGITLLEVLLAISLISTGYIAIAKLQISLWQNTRLTTQRNQAMSLSSEKIEELDFSLPISQPSITGNDTVNLTNSRYSRHWAINQSTHSTRLTVDVQWDQGQTHLTLIKQSSSYTPGTWGIHHNEHLSN